MVSDIVVDADFDGLICGAILLRANLDARVHVANRSSLPSVLASLEAGGGRIFIADLSVNRSTWPILEKDFIRLSGSRAIEWYDTHGMEGSGAGSDPRSKYARLVLKPRSVSSRLVQRAYGDPQTERLARAAEMADQRQHLNQDRALWNQVYPAHIAVAAYCTDTAWLIGLIELLAGNPGMDLRDLPEVVRRATVADEELRTALARVHDKANNTFEEGLVAVWIDPQLPKTVLNRRSALTGKLAYNRTAIVAFPDEARRERFDVRGRRPWFWDKVDLKALDKTVVELGGSGSGGPGATHWDLPRAAMPRLVEAVRDLAPRLHEKARGRTGGVPRRGGPKE